MPVAHDRAPGGFLRAACPLPVVAAAGTSRGFILTFHVEMPGTLDSNSRRFC